MKKIYMQEIDVSMDKKLIFCIGCSYNVYEFCSLHKPLLVIPDAKISKNDSYGTFENAKKSLPKFFLRLASSTIPGAGLGVFASETLPRDIMFGPFKGIRCKEVKSNYCWQISNNSTATYLDGSDEYQSNWMRYINCSRHWDEQNLIAFQFNDDVYYRTIKTIRRGSELLVYYGSEYANALDIDLKEYNKTFNNLYHTLYKLHKETRKIPSYESEYNINKCLKIPKIGFNCDKSNYKTNEIHYATHHVSPNLKIEHFQCVKCGYSTKTERYLRRHLKRHRTLTIHYSCSKCTYKALRKEDLRLHELIHLPYEPISCEECEFKTKNVRYLKKHIKSRHSSD